MSQTREWSPKDIFITREGIKLIQSFGFDHVRLPIDEEELWPEFGCLPTIPEETRLKYYKDITDIFRENCIAYANWDYKGDFRIVEWDRKNLKNPGSNIELIKILTR